MEEQEFYSYFNDEQELKHRIQQYGKIAAQDIPEIIRDALKEEYGEMEDKMAEMKLYISLTSTCAKLVTDELIKECDKCGQYAAKMFLQERGMKWE